MVAKETRKNGVWCESQHLPSGGVLVLPVPGWRVDFLRLPIVEANAYGVSRASRGRKWTVLQSTMPTATPSQEEIAERVHNGPNIWIAVADGDEERVKLLLEHGGVTPVTGDMVQYTPIHAAASYGRHDLLRLLLRYPGVAKDAVNVRDEDGDTPLFFCEDRPTAELLVTEFGADPSLQNDEGITVRRLLTQAAQHADMNEHEELAEYLRSVTGEAAVPRSELLQRAGEEEEEEPADLGDDADDADVDDKADQLMEQVQRIMEEADAKGEDPTEKLREVLGVSLARQVLEGYEQAQHDAA